MKVKAITRGFDGAQIREAGDVFEVPDGSEVTPVDQGGWYEPVEEPKSGKAKKAAENADQG